MTYTLPSTAVTVIDVPEVEITSAKFVYNFYRKDEAVRDTGIFEQNFDEALGIKFDFEKPVNADVLAKFPRYNVITFVPKAANFNADQPVQPQILKAQKNLNTNQLLANNIDKIMNEDNFSNANFAAIGLQDSGLDNKLYTLFKGALSVKINSLKYVGTPAATPPVVIPVPDALTPLNLAKLLTQLTAVKSDVAADVLVNNTDLIEQIKATIITTQLNRKHVFTILNNIVNNPLTIFGDEFVNALSNTKAIQEATKIAYNGLNVANQMISGWDSLMKHIDAVDITEPFADFQPQRQLVGYIIYKSEIMPNGDVVPKEPLFAETPLATTVYDTEVKYGGVYQYRIRSIAVIKFTAIDLNSQHLFSIQSLISSRLSNKITISGIEYIPPPPPADFKIEWDYTDNVPVLSWEFPINSQRDIKYFQIFRRRTINDAFQLIRQYDFNDSVVLFPSGETINPALVTTVNPNIALTQFSDYEFTQDSTAIYALCCIDAHGYSSPYSAQYQITFDKFENKLKYTLVSTPNAPMTLPILLLHRDLFIDTIKTSGFEEVKIYFDPEYLDAESLSPNVADPGVKKSIISTSSLFKFSGFSSSISTSSPSPNPGFNVKLLTTLQNSTDGKYVLQLINTDLQVQKNIEITINDLRNTGG